MINNLGYTDQVIEDVEWENGSRRLRSNLYCRAVLPHFKAQRAGKIVSWVVPNPMPCISAYAVSKAGIVRFVETLAEEVKAFGIDVNAIESQYPFAGGGAAGWT